MASVAAPHPARGLRLELGPVSRVEVQVGYRGLPDAPAREQYLLDVPLPEPVAAGGFDEQPFLAALQPVVFLGTDIARHYSLHLHRWHTSWGASTETVQIGITVTTGLRGPEQPSATYDSVLQAFRAVLDLAGNPESAVRSRDDAVVRARRTVAALSGADLDDLGITSEQHHPDRGTWSFSLRPRGTDDRYAVLVGMVEGYAGSLRVRHEPVREVIDSVGTE